MARGKLTTRDSQGKKWDVVPVAGATRAKLQCARTGAAYCEHRPPFADQFLWLQQARRPFQSLCVLCEPLRTFVSGRPDDGPEHIYKWPTTWVADDPTPSFLAFAREREEQRRKRVERQKRLSPGLRPAPPKWLEPEYPGDDEFDHIPEALLHHIARHDAPVSDFEQMNRTELLQTIWENYGPVLIFTDFFEEHPKPEFMCLLTRRQPEVLGLLPGWLKDTYANAADEFVEKGDIRCSVALESCRAIVMENRGFKSVSGYDYIGLRPRRSPQRTWQTKSGKACTPTARRWSST